MNKIFKRFLIFAVLSFVFIGFTSKAIYAADNPYAVDNMIGDREEAQKAQQAQTGTTDGMNDVGAEDKDKDKKGGNTGGTGDNTVWVDSGNAVQDILYLTESGQDRFRGAISTISGITRFVDTWFIRIISIVAFFIISVALLKNALAGAYVANTKFWDKVADAHATADQISIQSAGQYFAGGGFKSTQLGGVKNAILAFIPNIKAFTDFDGRDMEPKAYFMKAIPQMIACVVIGIFIYNGFYRDTAATVGSMGTVLLQRAFSSISPESFVNKIFNTTSWPEFPQKGDPTLEGKHQLKVCEALKSSIISEFSDIGGTENKSLIVQEIADKVNNAFEGISDAYQTEGTGYHYEISNIKVIATNQKYVQSLDGAQQNTFGPTSQDISFGNSASQSAVADVPCRGYFAYVDLGLDYGHISDNDANNTIALVSFTMKLRQGEYTGGMVSKLTTTAGTRSVMSDHVETLTQIQGDTYVYTPADLADGSTVSYQGPYIQADGSWRNKEALKAKKQKTLIGTATYKNTEGQTVTVKIMYDHGEGDV